MVQQVDTEHIQLPITRNSRKQAPYNSKATHCNSKFSVQFTRHIMCYPSTITLDVTLYDRVKGSTPQANVELAAARLLDELPGSVSVELNRADVCPRIVFCLLQKVRLLASVLVSFIINFTTADYHVMEEG